VRRALTAALRKAAANHWLWAALAVAFWLATLATLAGVKYRGDLRGLLHLGSRFPHPAALADAPAVGPWGYDGQFYAALATDPLLLHPESPALLDNPPYRSQRVLLPLVAWLASFGHARTATFAYPLLCWLGTAAGFFALAKLLRDRGVPGFWVFLAALNVGVAASLTRSTPDGAAAALFLLGLVACRSRRPQAAAALWGAAVLARETLLVPVWGATLPQLWRQRSAKAAFPALLPTALLFLWTAALLLRFSPALPAPGGNLGLPLLGLGEKLLALAGGSGVHWMEVLAFSGLLLLLASALVPRGFGESGETAFFAMALFATLLSIKVYVEAFAYARVLLPLAWTGVLLVGEKSWQRWLAASGLVLQALAGLSLVHGEFLAAGGAGEVLRFLSQLLRR